MSKDLSKLIWPVTALVCTAVIGAGVYFGLQGKSPPTAPAHGAPSAVSAVNGTQANPTALKDSRTIVYVTRTGAYYHRASCGYLRRSRIPMKLSDAKKRYRPCSRCRPPQ